MNKVLFYAIIVLFLSVIGLFYSLHKERADKERYKSNQTALLADVDYYKSESGKNAASVQKLTLSYDELKKNYNDVVSTANDLKISLKRAQSVSNTSTETKVEIKTIVKDSIVYIEGNPVNTLAFDWCDPWTDIEGIIHNDSVNLNIQSTDTLVQIVHKIPHKFLFFKWGCKAIRQDIVSKNPHTNIVFTDYIELK
ncbi:DUF6549 family protein [Clavibacter sp.]|uniref:DUF6549 family protein n=1 Tax=Clavibacter sp. TaxID=1871044 RepID=UPI0019855E4F|nr:DUF6549 family protein [Clavibacter sp.]MBD5381940.1 hypothetical protein [Clavibacter sp.]